jgi:mRNA interferase RelE/StbE
MIIKIDKAFEKDTRKISEQKLLHQIADLIETLQLVNSISEIRNIKKLKSYSNYYRIRIGNYRIGLQINSNQIIFIRILHRKDIYTFFP